MAMNPVRLKVVFKKRTKNEIKTRLVLKSSRLSDVADGGNLQPFVRVLQDDNTQDMTRLPPSMIGSPGHARSNLNQSFLSVSQHPQQLAAGLR